MTAVSWKDLQTANMVAFAATCLTRTIPFVLNLETNNIQPVITRSKANVSGFDMMESGELLVLHEDCSLHIVRLDGTNILSTSCVSYLCFSCGDDFRDKLSLANNTVNHDNVPAQCDVCLVSFRDKVFMNRHRINCLLKCNNCSFKSKYPSKINSHTKSKQCK